MVQNAVVKISTGYQLYGHFVAIMCWPFQRANKYVLFKPARTPGTPEIRPEMEATGPLDIVGLSSEIIGFRNRGGGPVGHPQCVQIKTLTLNIKCLPKGHHDRALQKVDF